MILCVQTGLEHTKSVLVFHENFVLRVCISTCANYNATQCTFYSNKYENSPRMLRHFTLVSNTKFRHDTYFINHMRFTTFVATPLYCCCPPCHTRTTTWLQPFYSCWPPCHFPRRKKNKSQNRSRTPFPLCHVNKAVVMTFVATLKLTWLATFLLLLSTLPFLSKNSEVLYIYICIAAYIRLMIKAKLLMWFGIFVATLEPQHDFNLFIHVGHLAISRRKKQITEQGLSLSGS